MPSHTKILFIAMDAGDKFLLQDWAADGTLPNLRTLFAKGLVGNVVGLEGFYEGSTWPSFYTGVAPARHGVHSLTQLKPGSYEFQHIAIGEFIKREPFWDHLSRAGRRLAILDIPLTGIFEKLNGIQLVEWGTHDSIYGFCTWPPQLKREVLARFGPYPLTRPCDSFGLDVKEIQHFRELLFQCITRKASLTNYFFEQENWDFFAQVFTEGHCIGHQYWHLHDSGHPGYTPKAKAIVGDPVRDTYIAIDAAIGTILSHVNSETTVVFLASHRMAHYFGMQFLLPEILRRLGVAQPMFGANSLGNSPHRKEGFNALLRRIWRNAPHKIRDKLWPIRSLLRNWIDEHKGRSSETMYGLDLKVSKCFLLSNGDSVCGLRINLAGREPEGLVQPGADMDSLCDQLAQDFSEIVDLDTGLPIVKSVRRTAMLYQGEHLEYLPDLLIEWNDDKSLGGNPRGSTIRVGSDKIGVVEGVYGGRRTGDHRADGMFVAMGPGIKPGRMERVVSIMDFAPTFTHLLGVELPDVDGKLITEILGSN